MLYLVISMQQTIVINIIQLFSIYIIILKQVK